MEDPPAPIVVAIDGPAGSGKSTLARALALSLDLPYVNTGLMYRAVTLEAIRSGVDPADEETLTSIARRLRFDLDRHERPPQLRIDGAPPEAALAAPEVEALVSRVAAHASLRRVLRAEQRRLGAGGAVIEGRDIGSMVFPDATLRVRLEAHPEERASRRAHERAEVSTHEVSAAIAARDRQDERNVPPVDADLVIDSTGLGPEDVFRMVLDAVRERTGR